MFRINLKKKIIIYIILLILFISFSFLSIFLYKSNKFIKDELVSFGFHLVKDLSYASELVVSSEDPVFLQPMFARIFAEQNVVLVTVYNKQGNIIASKKKVEIEERIRKDVMEELLRGGMVFKRGTRTEKGEEIYDFYSPVFISEILNPQSEKVPRELAGFVRVGLSLEKIAAQSKAIIKLGFGITVLIILLGMVIVFFLADRMTSSIRQLIHGAEIIRKGDLSHRIEIKTGDEIEELSGAFNRMTEKLEQSHLALQEEKTKLTIKVEARTKELKELAEQREEMVKERTKELQKKIDELERFQKLTVARELKMIELKKELKKPKGRPQ